LHGRCLSHPSKNMSCLQQLYICVHLFIWRKVVTSFICKQVNIWEQTIQCIHFITGLYGCNIKTTTVGNMKTPSEYMSIFEAPTFWTLPRISPRSPCCIAPVWLRSPRVLPSFPVVVFFVRLPPMERECLSFPAWNLRTVHAKMKYYRCTDIWAVAFIWYGAKGRLTEDPALQAWWISFPKSGLPWSETYQNNTLDVSYKSMCQHYLMAYGCLEQRLRSRNKFWSVIQLKHLPMFDIHLSHLNLDEMIISKRPWSCPLYTPKKTNHRKGKHI